MKSASTLVYDSDFGSLRSTAHWQEAATTSASANVNVNAAARWLAASR